MIEKLILAIVYQAAQELAVRVYDHCDDFSSESAKNKAQLYWATVRFRSEYDATHQGVLKGAVNQWRSAAN